MNAVQNSLSEPRELGRLLVVHWRRWATVTLLATAAAVTYALVAPKTWQASQALIVRNEAVGGDTEPGKFRGAEDLKSIQETIMELSKSHRLLKTTLLEVGPPVDYVKPFAWPTDTDIENLKKSVKIAPPKGVEFGTSEVFYLEVRDKDRTRATELNSALSHQLQLHLQEIRDAKAQSMVEELNKAVQLAKSDLHTATAQLTVLEKQVGSDLSELRSLLDSNSSDTSLRRTVSEIENELRQFRGTEKANRQLLALLKEAQADPTRLVAAPNRLLDSQPALRRLKDGLVDSQLRTATLQGRMSAAHPAVLSAKEAEIQVAGRLHAELSTAIRGMESELTFDANRLEMLENQRNNSANRLARLAGLRATYMNILSETTNRAKLLDRAEQNLTNARSNRASARAASLITCVDAPDTGTSPITPSGSMIVLGGLLGGLLTGLGIVLLTAPTTAKTAPQPTSLAAFAPQCTSGTALSPYAEPVSHRTSSLTPTHEPWSLTVAAHGSLNCTQALKLLNEQGKFSSATLS
ncbi:MAG: Wzz/FepE/Etk N-terminal domain-containing protein [Planctomycetota bacterium]